SCCPEPAANVRRFPLAIVTDSGLVSLALIRSRSRHCGLGEPVSSGHLPIPGTASECARELTFRKCGGRSKPRMANNRVPKGRNILAQRVPWSPTSAGFALVGVVECWVNVVNERESRRDGT